MAFPAVFLEVTKVPSGVRRIKMYGSIRGPYVVLYKDAVRYLTYDSSCFCLWAFTMNYTLFQRRFPVMCRLPALGFDDVTASDLATLLGTCGALEH